MPPSGAMLFVQDLGAMLAFYSYAMRLVPKAETRSETWVEFACGLGAYAIPEHVLRNDRRIAGAGTFGVSD